MEISQINSVLTLTAYFRERDTNSSGFLDTIEATPAIVAAHDDDGNGALSPWEVMDAANQIQRRQIFSASVIANSQNGDSFPAITLETAANVQGTYFVAGTTISWDRSGNIGEFRSPANVRLGGILWAANRTTILYDGNAVFRGVTAEPLAVFDPYAFSENIFIAPGTEIDLYLNQTLWRTTLAGNTSLNGRLYADQTEAIFFASTTLRAGTLAEETNIQGIWFPAGTRLVYYENGLIRWADLVADTPIDTGDQIITFFSHSRLEFTYYGLNLQCSEISGIVSEETNYGDSLYYPATQITIRRPTQ